MKSVCVFPDSEKLAEEIARSWLEQARQAVNNCGTFSVVLSGGSQDPELYGRLAEPKWRDHIPWESVHIFFADERCVPPDDNESNYKTICGNLLNYISIPEKNIHRMRGENDPTGESFRYAEEIQNHLVLRKGETCLFDWVFLGVGPDGHTASIFASSDLKKSNKLCEKTRHPKTGQYRITMTPLAIKNSKRITYHATGKRKAEIVFKLATDPSASNTFPAAQIRGEWFLDKEAASRLDLDLINKLGKKQIIAPK
jgi:6-phosphogluconolactonase|tara:strand:- start:241 stop:1005 length:765 start_codon:yes stop_codon:yes gene_type:complete